MSILRCDKGGGEGVLLFFFHFDNIIYFAHFLCVVIFVVVLKTITPIFLRQCPVYIGAVLFFYGHLDTLLSLSHSLSLINIHHFIFHSFKSTIIMFCDTKQKDPQNGWF